MMKKLSVVSRRRFVAAAALASVVGLVRGTAQGKSPRKILLRSSWQEVNIGDIAHTPGMLALLEKHKPDAEITLWPTNLGAQVEQLLTKRFPKLRFARTAPEQIAALTECDFFLHGSGPGLVGRVAAKQAQRAGKPYGFAGITLSDDEIKNERELLSGAKFVYCRDTDSLKALKASGLQGPNMDFGPDATFALDLRDDAAAAALLKKYQLEAGRFICAVPRLRWTPYWEIRPERVKPDPERSAVNEAFAERDHAKLREAIIAWVRQVKQRVILVPEMTYEVVRLRPLLYDPLPADVKPHVAVLDRYWLTAEAAGLYAQAAAVVSLEMHSPIMAVANNTPAILLRTPTDTRKGQMWRDVGLGKWIFEIDESTGQEIAARTIEIGRNLSAARATAQKARAFADERMAAMIAQID